MKPIEEAFSKVPRVNFVPDELKDHATIDAPLPIGFGQTISQPTTVKMMLGWLGPQPGDKILDVGSGSGWTSALLAYLVGSAGKVYSVEIIPELLEFGRQNCQRLGIKNVRFYKAGKKYGLPRLAPFNCILVSAAATALPQELLEQLKKDGGKMVIPVNSDVLEIIRASAKEYEVKIHTGFAFVPLVDVAGR